MAAIFFVWLGKLYKVLRMTVQSLVNIEGLSETEY